MSVRNKAGHRKSTSSDFGVFAEAPTPQHDQAELLRSFDPLMANETSSSVCAPPPPPASMRLSAGGSRAAPIHVNLPPPPDSMPADYGVAHSPPRFAHPFTFAGPSSPPALATTDGEIVFHPARTGSDAASEFRRIRRYSNDQLAGSAPHRKASLGDVAAPQHLQHSPLAASQPASPSAGKRLVNTLTTTTKLASKWRAAVGPALFDDPRDEPPPQSRTALPIDITHDSPFATPEQLAGSYVAPSGAPAFSASASGARVKVDVGEGYAGTKLLGRRELTTPVFMGNDADQLRATLPARQRLSDKWTLLFSLDQHGASLSTLYRQVEKYAATNRTTGNVLVVRDGDGAIFGVYLNEPIYKREGTYYGSGESFLFKRPLRAAEFKVFKWTGKNQYFALCENHLISFGGGAGAYGLILDSTFSRNSSATCPAFDNEVLCGPDGAFSQRATAFDCIGLEVWATS
ncbi:oxidation resistance protein 1 [Cryptotrichosporon argae]